MTTPVRRLSISHPDLPQAVEIDLPWDSFPEGQKDVLDALDANDDGVLTYAPQLGGSASAEVQHANGTADRLSRVLWGLGWIYPHNQRNRDRGTEDDRWRNVQTFQNRLFDRVVQPLLGDGRDPARWRLAARILSESGDFTRLHRLAIEARGQYERTSNVAFLRQAEEMFLEAKRLAVRVRAGRLHFYPRIQAELAEINPVLDRTDREQFQTAAGQPYLMATIGSPITADLATLQQENGYVTFGVAVPRSFVQAHPQDLNGDILRHFNEQSPASLRASPFQDSEGTRNFRLTAVHAERDQPGSADDPIGAASSFHLDHGRLGRTAFSEQGEMIFYRVRFRLQDRTEASSLMADRPIRRFDITLGNESGNETNPANRFRRISGGFVLQNMAGRTSHDVFASDVHVHERDYEIVRVMADSLRSLAARYESDHIQPDQIPTLRSQAQEVERFYESVNEQVEAAVAVWNEAYRNGEIHRVFLAGDLADFVNIAVTLEHRNYRSTNIRRLREVLGRLEAPLFVVSGNHDHHGQGFPLSLHVRNFINAGSLRDLYATHYDGHRFPNSILYVEGVKGLLPDTSSHEGWFTDAVRELSADDPFGPPNDAFLDHHMRELGIYETYGVGLGNGFRVFAWPTESEHFNYARHLLSEIHDPVTPAVISGISEYIGRQHVNGKGPRPENFVAFLREMEFARSQNQRLILMGHYPAFYAGEGPDQTPDSVDTLRGDAAWAVRMASWYYRRPNGETVMPLSVAGHVHHYGESDFVFHFANGEENQFRTALGSILQRKNAASIYDELHHLRHEWDLDNRIEIRRVQDPGSNGLPGPILSDLNQDSSAYCRRRGTAYLNLPSLGIPSEEGGGYVVVSTHSNGRIDVAPKMIRVGTDARIVQGDGSHLEAFRRQRWQEARDWDPARSLAPFQAHISPTAVTTTGPGVPGSQPHWDLLPLVYQYPRSKISLGANAALGVNLRDGRFDWTVGGTLLFPLSHDIHSVLGGPNYLTLGAGYWNATRDLRLQAGLDWGILTTYLNVDQVTRGKPMLGGEVYLHGIFPHAGLSVSGGSTFDGDWSLFLGLRFDQSIVTYRLPSGSHPHH